MDFTSKLIGQLSGCGLLSCRTPFIISFTATSLFLILVNIYIYKHLSSHVSKNYPEPRCGE